MIVTFDRHIEHHAGCGIHHSRFDHLSLGSFWAVMPSRDDTIDQMSGQFASFSG
jgi:hypothetical protein